MPSRVHHMNIRVADPEATIGFYEALGFAVTGYMNNPGVSTVYLALPNDPVGIELSVQDNPDPSWDRQPGSGHLALSVEDLDAELERLGQLGIEPEGPPFHPGDRPNVYVCFLRDPNQVRIELVDGPFPPPNDPLPWKLPYS
jgi:lactoylglutathione lyase